MPVTYPPKTDRDLLAFSRNLTSVIAKAPERYGVSEAIAAELDEAQQVYDKAYAVANSPNTGSTMNIRRKNEVKATLKRLMSQCVREIQKRPETTNEMRTELGLRIPREPRRGGVEPRRMQYAPEMHLYGTQGDRVTVRLRQTERVESRGKPEGAAGATFIYCVSDGMPSALEQWQVLCTTKKTLLELEFPASVPEGVRVWITAAWFNAREEHGPAALPESVFLTRATARAA